VNGYGWGDVLGDSLDAGLPVMRHLATQKLIDEGVIHYPSSRTFPIVSPNVVASQSPPQGVDLANVGVLIAIVLIALALRR
jgi:hypothetical protein